MTVSLCDFLKSFYFTPTTSIQTFRLIVFCIIRLFRLDTGFLLARGSDLFVQYFLNLILRFVRDPWLCKLVFIKWLLVTISLFFCRPLINLILFIIIFVSTLFNLSLILLLFLLYMEIKLYAIFLACSTSLLLSDLHDIF